MKQKANQLLWCLSLICMVIFTSCKSIIEEDITDKKVIVNSPNSSSLRSYNQLFWWEKLDGSLNYQLQIASPSFDSIQKLVLDTLVKTNKVRYTLASGRYEWRVRALNGSYQTPYSGSKFTIVDADLNTQYVLLKAPTTGTSVNTVSVSWYPIPVQGVSYQLKVSKSSTFSPALTDIKTPLTSYNLTLTDETTYYWQVRAIKGTDTSYWSNPSSFIYDIASPGKPTLTAPANTTSVLVPTTGNMTWTSVETGAKYYVYVTYGTDAEQKFTVNTNSYAYTAGQNQTVKWRVQAFDTAGNVGITSDTWTFKTGTAVSRLAK
ncbi:MAG: hypothetical protein H7282_14750 [Cytophagaceae bacterium]|nr:hypothetical protein [Cytophagaceae bacterium]